MSDPAAFITLGMTATAAIAIAAVAGLKGWQEWLELRRIELSSGQRRRRNVPPELSELRERVRRLEAVANGADI
jgi:hypothetical protein